MECRLSVRAENALVTWFLTQESVTPQNILSVDWQKMPGVGRKAMMEIVEFARDLEVRQITDVKRYLNEWRAFMAQRLVVNATKNRRLRGIPKPDTKLIKGEAAKHICSLLVCPINRFREGGGDVSDYESIPLYIREPIEWLAKVWGQSPHEVLALYRTA